MTPTGTKPATFRLVAQCLNQLRHRACINFMYTLQFACAYVGVYKLLLKTVFKDLLTRKYVRETFRKHWLVKLFTSNRLKPFIYNLTNDCTYILNTTITNNMLLHVSAFKMSSSGSSLCLAKITRTYRFSGLSKIKLLKYKTMNFNEMLIVQRDKSFA